MSNNGEVEIWANDFGTAFDCDGEEVEVWFKNESGDLTTSLTLTCSDLEGNAAIEKELSIYAVDGTSNESSCSVTLRIVDSNNACGNADEASGAAVIFGEVRTENGDMNERVEVSLGTSSQMTESDGKFAFDNNPMGYDYSISASKEDEYLNGVSTLDLVLIQKHIVGIELLDSPYKVIAADINNDGKVSGLDLVELRKLILNIITELPNTPSWRFVDANKEFRDLYNPFPLSEGVDLQFLTDDTRRDLISIKVGDVNGNAVANSLLTDSRKSTSLNFNVEEQSFNKGDWVKVSFSSQDFNNIYGFQFTLNTQKLSFVGVNENAIEIEKDHVGSFTNAITMAWSNLQPLTTSEILFTLQFEALEDGVLSESFSLNSSKTQARAYDENLALRSPTLSFSSKNGTENANLFELYQNQPNPFADFTTISFNIGNANAQGTLAIFDVTGKTVKVIDINSKKGLNQVVIDKAEIGRSGIFYYQLESGDFIATRKMIILE